MNSFEVYSDENIQDILSKENEGLNLFDDIRTIKQLNSEVITTITTKKKK